ncbi:mucolipin-3-like isoform X1 [Limulus polyphemus]|uniref:Mucolipin-3-like isoform X1 n=1 Tax=Limulus polyphemus TaxID=6850 RepID=A0ABM1BWB8_LIMPO|nr:mucolipin-3-like isoform X1 [Limulus polyphemus]
MSLKHSNSKNIDEEPHSAASFQLGSEDDDDDESGTTNFNFATDPKSESGFEEQQNIPYHSVKEQASRTTGMRRSRSFTPHMRDRMRRKLQFFFMNPIEKWQAKGRVPWKLGLQVIKIIFITVQLALFGYDASKYRQQHENTVKTFRHVFLKGWDATREIVSYPPATGQYAVYTKPEFFQNIDNVIHKYATITDTTIGSYGYDSDDDEISSMWFCKRQYRKGEVFAFNVTLHYDSTPVDSCLEIAPLYPAGDKRWENFHLQDFLKDHNSSVNFNNLIYAELKFSLKTVFLKSLTRFDSPDCFLFDIVIKFDNSLHDGQVLVFLNADSKKLICNSSVQYVETDKVDYYWRQVLNGIVILLCIMSLALCCRSLYKGQLLRQQTIVFFNKQYGKSLSFQDQLEFVDFWYVLITVNDGLIIVGSAMKFQIEQKIIEGDQYNVCSILLGTGNLLVWLGILRYLGFFKKYNVLILTLKMALPNVLRFTLCVMLLYCGFCFCGWVVLGPYHIKFRFLSTTSECLFAMMNGDDLFATFAILNTHSDLVWWFSRIYLYVFISLFIYVVISLFIAVIMDSYDTIKRYHEQGFPKTDLQDFISESNEEATSGVYRQDSTNKQLMDYLIMCCLRPCRQRQREYEEF